MSMIHEGTAVGRPRRDLRRADQQGPAANRPAQPDLVSVIIPAYNAAATIDETLRSVRAQTYANLEILVVDDGSKDETAQIVARHASQDARVRLVQQANGGVARARNHGIEQAKADFVALVDADDLWRADKIAKQMQALHEGGEKVGLVYTWFALIDENSVVTDATPPEHAEGDVLRSMYRKNIIGNGSSPLMRKAAVLAVGGYEPRLRDNKAQGCEDHLIYARMAEHSHFAVVQEFLTGYRQTRDNMSSDTLQMLRSWTMTAEELTGRHPELTPEIDVAECAVLHWLYLRSVRTFQSRRAWAVMAFMARRHPMMAVKHALLTPIEILVGVSQALRRSPARNDGVKFLDTAVS